MTGADLEAARRLLERMGITPEELLPTARTALSIPTFADYIPALADATPVGARRTYQNYWDRVVEVWGERRLNEPTSLELQQLVETTGRSAVVRRNHRGGRSAAEHMVSALRCLYRAADADGFVPAAASPVRGLIKPRRLPSTRRALSTHQLEQIIHVATTTGNDKELDYLLLRIHIETACRTGSALGLRPCDLDTDLCLIRLFGKGGTVHWQPISPTLMFSLITHSLRGSDEDAQLLRYTNGRPITRRRYDHLWSQVGRLLPWVSTQQISTHWLRHTTLTWVERKFGYAIARGYAAHSEPSGQDGATLTYVRASLEEVAAAVSELTGEAHPLTTVDAEAPEETRANPFAGLMSLDTINDR